MDSKLNHFTFTKRAIPLYPNYRPMYKISLILMILYLNGYNGKASLLKLHLFSWALKSPDNLDALKHFAISNQKRGINFFGIELTLNRALHLAIAEGLVEYIEEKYGLLPKGNNFINDILKNKDLFVYEKQVLKLIGKKITDKKMNDLKNIWNNA